MAKHGGTIQVESTPGGATFLLSFPAVAQPSPEAPAPRPVAPPGRGRILVMDDELPVRRLLARILAKLGYEADVVAEGEAAVASFQRALRDGRRYDAVILDLTIPGGMGGAATIGELRRLDPQIKAVVSSGYSTDPILSDHAAHGFDAVMSKPYTFAEVADTLGRLMVPDSPA
jgi:CheY-like chemotaxis protein